MELILVDLDGTLCKETCFTEEECLYATPKQEVIDWVNNKYNEMNCIIIYTARQERLRFETEYWLRKNGVLFHAIDLGRKPPADIYLDDRAIDLTN